MGVFGIPVMIGPVVGPIIGGAIANQWGWRAIFVVLAICAGVSFVGLLIFLPETHLYFFFEKKIIPQIQSGGLRPPPSLKLTPEGNFRNPVPKVKGRSPCPLPITLHAHLRCSTIFILFFLLQPRYVWPWEPFKYFVHPEIIVVALSIGLCCLCMLVTLLAITDVVCNVSCYVIIAVKWLCVYVNMYRYVFICPVYSSLQNTNTHNLSLVPVVCPLE